MPVLFMIGGIALVIGVRLFMDRVDRERIRSYVAQEGGRVESITWSPFGKGWFGSQHSRIYEVTYADREDRLHRATCKTSLFGGVYWTEDVKFGGPIGGGARGRDDRDHEIERLRAENERLRSENKGRKDPGQRGGA
ncbi:MAG: hypothetical protein ACYS9X_32360, partial [Planctomycetota bacterium]